MKTSNPKWSILIATLGQREERFKRLLDRLMPQVKGKNVEVVAYWNNFERPLHEIRQALVDNARGEYVNFIDDDDLVPEYYVAEVLKAIESKPDYVGWQQQLYMNGDPTKPTFHSIKYPKWTEDDKGWYRGISHLNPIKKNLALKAPFVVPEGMPEDSNWAELVSPFVKNETYIERIMYFYYPSVEDSQWKGGRDFNRRERPIIRRKNFRWHPESKRFHGNT